ncbi:hypothetical protein B0H14DRAFT_2946360 [Mycena olivaceomarginata]|nr:hypothetical protein B0H14DRAFT_2946360 [Mycena olivaceomarginata]
MLRSCATTVSCAKAVGFNPNQIGQGKKDATSTALRPRPVLFHINSFHPLRSYPLSPHESSRSRNCHDIIFDNFSRLLSWTGLSSTTYALETGSILAESILLFPITILAFNCGEKSVSFIVRSSDHHFSVGINEQSHIISEPVANARGILRYLHYIYITLL